MKKKLFQFEGVKALANTLSGDAKKFADAVVAAFESAEAEDVEHDIISLKTKVDEIAAQFAQQNEEVADKVNRVKNEILAQIGGTTKDVKDKFTPKVCNEIAHAMLNARDKSTVVKDVMDVAVKNDLTGLSFEQVVDYAIQFHQDDSDEIFDALYKTNRTKIYFAEIDETNSKEIAKQWNGLGNGVTEKEIQELAVEGKSISTKYVYKRQRVAQEDLDDAAEHGQEAALEGDVRNELRKAVKALIVKSILVGDAVNSNGSKVTTFETIGTKKRTDPFTTVVNPTVEPNKVFPSLADLRAAAAAVKTERKWLFITDLLKQEVSKRMYATGGTPFFFSDEELAQQIGVDRIITKDYINNVAGLHAIVLDPNEYWVKAKNEIDIAVPEYWQNSRGYMYEINGGGIVRGLRSTAILRDASGSSSK